MSDGDLSQRAGEQFGVGAGYALEDAQLRSFHYHLLRLTVAGLSSRDVKDLGELGRLAFEGLDMIEELGRIQQRNDLSPLGSAIAGIVAEAGRSGAPATLSSTILGAVLGAYAAVGD